MIFTHEQVVAKLKTSPYNVFYNPLTPADAVAEGLKDNSIPKFLKIWSINQNTKLLCDMLASNSSILYLQLGTLYNRNNRQK